MVGPSESQKAIQSAQRFAADRRGSMAVWFALGMVAICGMGAVAVDLSRLYVFETQLQGAADAAALAAIDELPDENAARSAAIEYAGKNLDSAVHGTALSDSDVEFGTWDEVTRTFDPAGSPENAVRVSVRMTEANGNAASNLIGNVLGFSNSDVSVQTIAGLPKDPVCVLSLELTAKHTWLLEGDVSFYGPDCDVYVNSEHSNDAVDPKGSGTVITSSIKAVGYGHGNLQNLSPPLEDMDDPIPDPLDGVLAVPSAFPCDEWSLVVDEDDTLSPGVYCGGLTIEDGATVTLDPGLYVVSGDKFLVDEANVEGDGVTIYLADEDAEIDWRGDEGEYHVNLSAQTTGPYAGIVLFEPSDDNKTHSFDEVDFNLEGTVYLPNGRVEIVNAGTSNDDPDFTVFIALEFVYDGSGTVTMNYDYLNSDVPLHQSVKNAIPGSGSARLLY